MSTKHVFRTTAHARALASVAKEIVERLDASEQEDAMAKVMLTLGDHNSELIEWLAGNGAMHLVGSVQHEGDIALTTFATFERDGDQFAVYVEQEPMTYKQEGTTDNVN